MTRVVDTKEFYESLPHGPLVRLIAGANATADVMARGGDRLLCMEMLQHHLLEIAQYTAYQPGDQEYVPPEALRGSSERGAR